MPVTFVSEHAHNFARGVMLPYPLFQALKVCAVTTAVSVRRLTSAHRLFKMALQVNKVLISDSVDVSCREILEKAGVAVDYKPGLSKEDLLQCIKVTTGRWNVKLTLHWSCMKIEELDLLGLVFFAPGDFCTRYTHL